ncbi:MAG: phosphate transport system substrate-binding protein [Bacillota bacterium]|nr:MAG: phosphate transport system substrate-binding protein [Bacillota bacterium]MBS3949274.1 phosphate ABC transporter substrate-binding protein [Peptococcaceae bacterium]
MKKLVVVLLVALMAVAVVGCRAEKAVIDINGSDTMVNIGAALAENFMKTNKNIEIVVSGGGSGTGIAALINGATNIAQSSRAMKQSEKDQASAKGLLNEIIVAWDGLAVTVHPSNPVRELTLAQIAKIYRGEITNWQEVGGNDANIVLLSRDTTSGTYIFFKEFVVQENGKLKSAEFSPAAMMMPSTEAIVQESARNVNAIGYVGLGYLKTEIKALGVKVNDDSAASSPSVATVLDKTYSLARPLYFYTVGELKGAIKTYVDYVLSDNGQKVVRELDFVPIR